MIVCVPSYKRTGKVKTLGIFPMAKLFVHEFEAVEYKNVYPDNEIVAVPDKLSGNMAKVRNFILENAGDERILMCDDDIDYIGYFQNAYDRGSYSNDELYKKIENLFDACDDAGTKLWGINLLNNPKAYRQYSPFSFLSIVYGSFMGIIKSDIRFDERLGLKEDVDFSIQHLKKYRRILRLNKMFYQTYHVKIAGGCASYRTSEEEKKNMSDLQKKWGSEIVKIRKSINPVVIVPIAGI